MARCDQQNEAETWKCSCLDTLLVATMQGHAATGCTLVALISEARL